jgi:hypothetical protein
MNVTLFALLLTGAANAGAHKLAGPGWSAQLTPQARVLRFGAASAQMEMVDAQTPRLMEAGNRIRYSQVYDGIHLDFYRNGGALEYDFVVAPGADPTRIAMRFPGAVITIGGNGDLVIVTANGEIRHRAPFSYQVRGGRIQEVASRFVLRGRSAGFELAAYDRSTPLVIDPVLTQRFVAGSVFEPTTSLTRDSAGNSYLASYSLGANLTLLRKVSPTGVLLSSTPLPIDHGPAPTSIPTSILEAHLAVDSAQSVYVGAQSKSCPANATTIIGSVAVPGTFLLIFKYLPDAATISYLTCLRLDGENRINAITVDASGNAYVAGTTAATGFPASATFGPVNLAGSHGFVTKVNSTGQSFPFSILFGAGTEATSVFLDSAGNVYAGGVTGPNFQTFSPVQPVFGGGASDGFLMKVRPDGLQILNATFLGGNGADAVRAVTVLGGGQIAVAGETSSANFHVAGPASTACVGSDGFITLYSSATDSVLSSTCVPGADQASLTEIVRGSSSVLAAGQIFGSRLLVMKLDGAGAPLYTSQHVGLKPAGLFLTSGGFATGGMEGFPATPAVWIFEERANLAVTLSGSQTRVTNAGPDPATGTVLTVTVPLGATIQTQDPRCGNDSSGQRFACKLGTVRVGDAPVVNFTATGPATAQVQSQVADPQLSNNQTRP